MRTTVDLPDELFRRAKAEAALRGRKFKDLIEEGLRLMIEKPPSGDAEKPAAAKAKPTAHDLLKHLIFEDSDGPSDLSTNKKYLDDLGT
jgi:hypothetical protein